MNILNGLSHERFDMDMNQSKMLPQKWKLFSFYAERIRIMSYHKSKVINRQKNIIFTSVGFADYYVELNVPGYGLLSLLYPPLKSLDKKNKISLVAIKKKTNSD